MIPRWGWGRFLSETCPTPSRLYYDAILYDQETLTHLVSYVDKDRVMYGSDYPFSLGDMPGILARVDKLAPRERDAVRGDNARRLFGIRI